MVNASWGLGEALVSGELVPDRWVVDKVTSRTVECQRGTKGDDRPDELCLDDAQRTKVVETVCAIESLYGDPVDVEWAFAGGALHVLQARPITTYVPLPPELQTSPGEPRLLYLDPSLADGLTMSGAVSPLTNDLIMMMAEGMLRYVVGDVTLDRDLKQGVYGVSGARIYANLSHIMHLVDVKKAAPARRLIDATLADIYETVDLDRYVAARPPPYMRKGRLLLATPSVLWRTRGFLKGMAKAMLRGQAFQEQYREALRTFERDVDLPPDESMPMSQYAMWLYGQVGRVGQVATAPALVMHVWRGTQVLDRLIDSTSEEQRRLSDAIKAGADDLVFEMGIALHHLSTLLPAPAFDDIDARTFAHRAIAIRRVPRRVGRVRRAFWLPGAARDGSGVRQIRGRSADCAASNGDAGARKPRRPRRESRASGAGARDRVPPARRDASGAQAPPSPTRLSQHHRLRTGA